MENNINGIYGLDSLSPTGNRSNFNRFSPLNIGSIDYNTSNRDLEYDDEQDEIYEEDEEFESREIFEDDEDRAFRSHRL
jgi:hypothetical protein